MRVISQSKDVDVRYDQIIVQRNENIVQAIPISTGVMIKTLGQYETPDKAEKAMEMLRKQYMKMKTQNVIAYSLNEGLKRLEEADCSMDEYNEVLESMMSMFAFQFPQDSEVEEK